MPEPQRSILPKLQYGAEGCARTASRRKYGAALPEIMGTKVEKLTTSTPITQTKKGVKGCYDQLKNTMNIYLQIDFSHFSQD